MELVVNQKVTNNGGSESKFGIKDQQTKNKGRIGEERRKGV